jgi:AraC-like DNA-binding protein
VKNLHERLLETPGLKNKIELVENFFTKRLPVAENVSHRIKEVGHILTNMKKNYTDENIGDIAARHGISSRYLHKLVSQYTGLSPKFHNKINRFQQSLKLITNNRNSLTSIAYDCGYFDQSHFIKDFKSFTGVTPSAYLDNKFSVNQILLQ